MKKLFLFLFTLFASLTQAQYNSLLWKISGNGLQKPSYLYGTMHTSDKRVFNFGDSVMPFFKKAKAYAMELDPAEGFSLGLAEKLTMPKGNSLKKMIPEHEYKILDSVIKDKMGISVVLLDKVAPVLTMTLFQMATMGLDEPMDKKGKEVLDLHFHKLAQKAKKKIIGIETIDEQLDALNALTYTEQAEMLVETIRDFELNEGDAIRVLEFYFEQNLDSLFGSDDIASMPEKFYKALITDRNARMADRIDNFMQEQPTFIAIGALHLPGAEGVIELLRQKGFTVVPVR